MRTAIPLTVLATALACSLATAPANARARVFVASYGNDANPCTFGSPCKTFQQAVNVVDAGGEVTAIDSAGFGPIVISRSVTITSPPGVEAGIVSTSTLPAILIFGGDVIQLRGLTIDGTGGGTDGIYMQGAGSRVEIIDCSIRNFSHDGIDLTPGSGDPRIPNTIIISNTVASDNGSSGIELNPAVGNLRGALDHVITSGNSGSGIFINGTTSITNGFIDFAISNGVSDSNSGDGITVNGVGNVKLEVRDFTISNNKFNGITVINAIVGLYANTIAMNNVGFFISNATINSFSNNVIENNVGLSTGTLTHVTGQ